MREPAMQQGSEEWLQARLGLPTASRMSDLLARTKSGWGAGRQNLMSELLCERLTNQPYERFVSGDMMRGMELESEAVVAYEIEAGEVTQTCGFIQHPWIKESGASPDRLIADDGVLEVKCPKTATHLKYLLDGEPPADYIPQMVWQLACTRRRWVNFVSYDPRLPEDLRLFIVRFEPNWSVVEQQEQAVERFLYELHELESKVRSRRRQ